MNWHAFGSKLANILYSFLLFGLLINSSHEQFHQWGALASRVPDGGGYVTFSFTVAHYYYPAGFIPTRVQDLVVSLAGGLGVALAYGLGLAIRRLSLKYTAWDLDDIFSLQAIGLWQGLYAFSEIINWQYWGGHISGFIGFGIAILIYGERLLRWLEVEDSP